MKMSHFKGFKIMVFWLILGPIMSAWLEPSNIAKVAELDFESNHLTKRWQRFKEYTHQIEDQHWDKNLKYVKQSSQPHAVWNNSKRCRYSKTWLYGHPGAKFSSVIFKDAQKPKKFQRSSFSKSQNNGTKSHSRSLLLT